MNDFGFIQRMQELELQVGRQEAKIACLEDRVREKEEV